MGPEDTQRLERIKRWLNSEANLIPIWHSLHEGLPTLLLDFENYLLKCEAERQARG